MHLQLFIKKFIKRNPISLRNKHFVESYITVFIINLVLHMALVYIIIVTLQENLEFSKQQQNDK